MKIYFDKQEFTELELELQKELEYFNTLETEFAELEQELEFFIKGVKQDDFYSIRNI